MTTIIIFWKTNQAETDHVGLLEQIEKIGKLSAELKEGGTIDAMLEELIAYEKAMIPHLKHEEDECLPLTRAYFTPEEVGKMAQEIISKGPKVRLLFRRRPVSTFLSLTHDNIC